MPKEPLTPEANALKLEVLKQIEARGEFGHLDDGYLYWFPSVYGALNPAVLRIIADELEERNAEWHGIVTRDMPPDPPEPQPLQGSGDDLPF